MMHLHYKTCIAIRFNVCSVLTNILHFILNYIMYISAPIVHTYCKYMQPRVDTHIERQSYNKDTRENNRIMSTDIVQQKFIYMKYSLKWNTYLLLGSCLVRHWRSLVCWVVCHCILVLGVLRLRRRPSSWILLYQDSETLRLKNIPY